MIFSTTERGFARIDFTDRYGVACSLQQSSLATEDAIWLGCNEPNPRRLVPGQGWQPVSLPEGTLCDTRMHLTRDHVAQLVTVLQQWLDATSDDTEEDAKYIYEFRYISPLGNGNTAETMISRMVPHLSYLAGQPLSHTVVNNRSILVRTTVAGAEYSQLLLAVPKAHYGLEAALMQRIPE